MTYEELLDVKRAIEKLEHDMRMYNVDVHEYVTVEELVTAIQCIEKLTHYEDLEEQGRLIELPCAVGDTVYEVQKTRKRIQEYTVISIHYSHSSFLIRWKIIAGNGIYSTLNGFEASAIGKTVFLTKEEAEAKLKELRGDEE